MLKTLLNKIRTQAAALIVQNGASAEAASTFMSSIGDGTLLQMLLNFIAQNGPEIESFIQLLANLFAVQQS